MAATGSLSTETFDSFSTDTSFNNGVTVNLTGLSLTGIGNRSSQNLIDASPFNVGGFFSINGTSYLNGITGDSVGLNVVFTAPISAFGATFKDTSTVDITRLRIGSDTVAIPQIISPGFFGFTADSNFTTLTFESADGFNDVFGADDFRYGSATPIPFEFNPAFGVGIVFAAFVVKKQLKKK